MGPRLEDEVVLSLQRKCLHNYIYKYTYGLCTALLRLKYMLLIVLGM